jgi:hypothetical protein
VTQQNKTEMISRRRAFSFLGLAALSLAVSPMVLTISDAEAQQPSAQNPEAGTTTTPQAGATTNPQTGTERRQERRAGRTERRQERRTGRTERRTERREGRTERRTERHGTTPSTTSPTQKP